MLCCLPPFQAASPTEIYQKSKAVDYHWPKPGAIGNEIPDEAKDLVAGLLKPNPEDRLNLDETVSHPFFRMHGGDCIPAVLDPSCRKEKPNWLSSAKPHGDVMHVDAPRLKLRDLAEACGVGSFDKPNESFSIVGGDVDISLYKACLAEEIANTCPRVPLPADIVYTGKILARTRLSIKHSTIPPVPQIPQSLRGKPQELDGLPEADNVADARSSQGHIATLRASSAVSSAHDVEAQTRAADGGDELSSKVGSKPAAERASMRGHSRMMNERPVRMSKTLPRNTARVTRSQKAGMTKEDAILVDEYAARPSPRLTRDQIIDQLSPNPDEKRREIALRGKARIAANLQNELNALSNEDRKPSRHILPLRAKRATRRAGWLTSPQDKLEKVPRTTSKEVNAILKVHKDALGLALWTVAEGMHEPELDVSPSSTDRFWRTPDPPPLITKWVDYTNKLGVGYTLANGTMGCIIKANEDYDNPLCGIHVAHTRDHYRKRSSDPSYSDAAQILPQSGCLVNFTETSEEDGISQITVPADRFKINADSQDLSPRMKPTRDIYETEKRRRLNIWSRFSDYMARNLGADGSDSEGAANDEKSPGPFLRFFQRLGNVTVWAFADGAFQFNFPDHTKMTLHRNGKWLEYYYLPASVMKRLKAGRALNQTMLESRKRVSFKVESCLRLCAEDHDDKSKRELKVILQANTVESKIRFVKDIFTVWDREGGLGRLGEDKYMRWDGFAEKKGLAWVSVGASGGDVYYKLPDEKEKK